MRHGVAVALFPVKEAGQVRVLMSRPRAEDALGGASLRVRTPIRAPLII